MSDEQDKTVSASTMVDIVIRLQESMKVLTHNLDSARDNLIRRMFEDKIDKVTSSDAKAHATVVVGERVRIDEAQLKKALTDKQWKQVTKRVIDRPYLETLMVDDIELSERVAESSTIVVQSPYIRLYSDK